MTALHYKQEDIDFDLEIGEYFLSIETTPYYEYVKTAYILIGTNIGTILLIGKDLQKKIYYLRKYTLKIEPIIKICYYNNNKLILSVFGDKIYIWKDLLQNMKSKNPNDMMFDYLNVIDNKCLIGKVTDGYSNIVSMYTFDGYEMIFVGVLGEIYFGQDNDGDVFRSSKLLNGGHRDKNIIDICLLYDRIVCSLDSSGLVVLWDSNLSFDICGYIDNGKDNKIVQMLTDVNCLLFLNEYKRTSSELNTNIQRFNFNNKQIDKVYDIIKNQQYYKHLNTKKEYIVRLYKLNNDIITAVSNYNSIYTINISQNKYNLLHYVHGIESSKYDIISLQCKLNSNLISISYNESTICVYTFEINKSTSYINSIKDKFNLFQYQSEQDETNTELKLQLSTIDKNKPRFMTKTLFYQNDLLCINEILSFIYIRDYNKQLMLSSIPLNNYYPLSIGHTLNNYQFFIGTKEGFLITITRLNLSEYKGFKIDISNTNFDSINNIKVFPSYIVVSSFNEICIYYI